MNRRRCGTRYCSAVNCSNSREKNADLSFFKYPRDAERCKVWVYNSGRLDLESKDTLVLNKSYQLCANHFEDSQFMNSLRKKLVFNAVPTIFPSENPPLLVTYDNNNKRNGSSSLTKQKRCSNNKRITSTQVINMPYRRNWGKSIQLERWRNSIQKAKRIKQASGKSSTSTTSDLPVTYEGLLMKYRGLENTYNTLKLNLESKQTELKVCQDELTTKDKLVQHLTRELERMRPDVNHAMERIKEILLQVLLTQSKKCQLFEGNIELPEWISELSYGGLIAFHTLLQYQKEN